MKESNHSLFLGCSEIKIVNLFLYMRNNLISDIKKCKETAFLLKRNPGERITFPRKVNQNQSFSKDCKEVKNGKIN